MTVRSRFLVVVGRVLAVAAAIAMGSALALAQVAAPPASEAPAKEKQTTTETERDAAPDQQANRNQKTDRQKDKDNATPTTPDNPNQPGKSRGDDPSGQSKTDQNKTSKQAEPRRSADEPREPRANGRSAEERTKGKTDAQERQSDDPTRGSDVRRRSGGREREGSEARGQQEGERKARGLGIQFDEQARDSISVNNVEAESDAARAGLRAGDRIISVDGRTLNNFRQFQAYLGGQYDRAVPVIIERGGQRYSVQLPAGSGSGDGPWLGIYLQDNEENQVGARITSVFPSGPAARAGLRTGDVILQVNGQEVASTPDFIATIDQFEPQTRVEFLVQRGDQELTIPTVLGNRKNFVFHRQGNQGRQSADDDDEYADVPPHAMQLEHDRRMAEQHERIENELRKLQDEVRQLRQLIEQRK